MEGVPFAAVGGRGARRPPLPPNDRPLIAGLVIAVLFAMECGAAYVAWRLEYGAPLGRPSAMLPIAWRSEVLAASILLCGTTVVVIITTRRLRVAGALVILAIAFLIFATGKVYAPTRLIEWQIRSAGPTRILLQ